MVATTTEFNSLLQSLRSDFPDIKFKPADEFRWSSSSKTVHYNHTHADSTSLLHEASHASLGHSAYHNDIDLIHLEREAWNKTVELGRKYGINIEQDTIESSLDTYRDWLHARSLCPTCKQNGVQTKNNSYACVICEQKWTVNDAKTCGLIRRKSN